MTERYEGISIAGRGARDSRPTARLLRMISRYTGPEAGVVERQLPFVLVYLAAMVVLRALPDTVTRPGLVVASASLAIAVTLLALVLPWRSLPAWAGDLLPVGSLVCVALLRAGTGGQGSLFAALLFVPVITLAAQPGRRGIVLATLGAMLVVFTPSLFEHGGLGRLVVARAVVVAGVACCVAVVAHETTERLRVRNAALNRLQVEQQRLLDLVRADAELIAREAAGRDAAYAQLVSVIDAATEQAIIATDADGMVQVFNAGAERLLGYAQGSVVGRVRLTQFHDPDELAERYAELFDHPVRGEGEQRDRRLLEAVVAPSRAHGAVRDWTYVAKDGTAKTVRLAVTRRHATGDTDGGYVVVATDVTAEREAAALKDAFVGLVSHELRTPLTAMLGYLELLQDGPDPLTADQRADLAVVERNARRQLRLVSDLLLTVQVEAGRFSIVPEQVDLEEVVRSSVLSVLPVAEASRVTLTVEGTSAPLHGDALRLGQVVDNLVTNALKFTPARGRVTVTVGPDEGGGARLEVADTGMGIPPDELEQLADRFFRSSNARRAAVPGVGLGLSIAKAVIDAHGGTLGVSSTLGEGTTFTVVLPPRPPDDPPQHA